MATFNQQSTALRVFPQAPAIEAGGFDLGLDRIENAIDTPLRIVERAEDFGDRQQRRRTLRRQRPLRDQLETLTLAEEVEEFPARRGMRTAGTAAQTAVNQRGAVQAGLDREILNETREAQIENARFGREVEAFEQIAARERALTRTGEAVDARNPRGRRILEREDGVFVEEGFYEPDGSFITTGLEQTATPGQLEAAARRAEVDEAYRIAQTERALRISQPGPTVTQARDRTGRTIGSIITTFDPETGEPNVTFEPLDMDATSGSATVSGGFRLPGGVVAGGRPEAPSVQSPALAPAAAPAAEGPPRVRSRSEALRYPPGTVVVLAIETTLPDGTVIPAGTRFRVPQPR